MQVMAANPLRKKFELTAVTVQRAMRNPDPQTSVDASMRMRRRERHKIRTCGEQH